MTRKRILAVLVCLFFVLVAVATHTMQDFWKYKMDSVDNELRQLEERRDSLIKAVDELERRCQELQTQISEHENEKND